LTERNQPALVKIGVEMQVYMLLQDGSSPIRELTVRDEIHIRNAEAGYLARKLARDTGRTITEIVLHALRQYRMDHHASDPSSRLEYWRHLLRDDRSRRLDGVETSLEALYDNKH
jgi:hypothetical protein